MSACTLHVWWSICINSVQNIGKYAYYFRAFVSFVKLCTGKAVLSFWTKYITFTRVPRNHMAFESNVRIFGVFTASLGTRFTGLLYVYLQRSWNKVVAA
jgi:hypothetical protein